MTKARNGDTVRINYSGRLTDGTEFDSSAGNGPLEFTLGEGQVIPGLEAHVEGMEAGTKSTVTIPPEAAYGPHRPEAIQTIDRASVPASLELKVGAQLQARTAEGNVMPITVVDLDDATVKVDANHPLAGRELVFDVELVEVVKAA
jgi:peptidylprolyl isomerase